MNPRDERGPRATRVEQVSERELRVSRVVNGPARLVFEAWTRPELFEQWWVPRSLGMVLVSYEADIRTGGSYRLVFRFGDSEPVAFFGRYLEVTPYTRVVWTNDERGEAGQVTTVTFEARGAQTLVVLSELYPSKEALEQSRGAEEGTAESFEQLDAFVATLAARVPT